MAKISTFRDDSLPSINSSVSHVQKKISVVNGSALSGDTIDVMGVAPGQSGFLIGAVLRASATLGVGVTVQLRVAGSAVTPATTAGGASKVDSSSEAGVPLALAGGELIDILVGGGNIGSAADLTVDLLFSAK